MRDTTWRCPICQRPFRDAACHCNHFDMMDRLYERIEELEDLLMQFQAAWNATDSRNYGQQCSAFRLLTKLKCLCRRVEELEKERRMMMKESRFPPELAAKVCPLGHDKLEEMGIHEGNQEFIYWCTWCGSLVFVSIDNDSLGATRIPKGYNETAS